MKKNEKKKILQPGFEPGTLGYNEISHLADVKFSPYANSARVSLPATSALFSDFSRLPTLDVYMYLVLLVNLLCASI